MARDPFAPVPQSSVPSWVWLVVGMIAFMLVGIGTTVAVVVSKRSVPVVATTTPTTPAAQGEAPTVAPTAAPTTDAKPAADKPAAAAAADADKGEKDDGEKSEKKKKSHKKSEKTEKTAKADKPAASAPAAPPPKKKSDMSQKDIDKLLGL